MSAYPIQTTTTGLTGSPQPQATSPANNIRNTVNAGSTSRGDEYPIQTTTSRLGSPESPQVTPPANNLENAISASKSGGGLNKPDEVPMTTGGSYPDVEPYEGNKSSKGLADCVEPVALQKQQEEPEETLPLEWAHLTWKNWELK